ncbi:hypothetical protein FGRMN_5256 [Fusarium graminum]|nr:hypothetical protein FGRMN_5256 [Fusarium graminum]
MLSLPLHTIPSDLNVDLISQNTGDSRWEKASMSMKKGNFTQIETREVFRNQSTTSTSADERMDLDLDETSTFNLSMHPGFNTYRRDILDNEANFLPTSRLSRDLAVFRLPVKNLNSNIDSPAMMVICIKLEANPDATFEQTSWISKTLVASLFHHYDIHSGFLLDLIGRPNYWSAVSQVKLDVKYKKDVFEFFCQHPRWHQKGRYDKEKSAMQGNRAPCSLYMTYNTATDTTVYLVVAPDDGIWFSFVDMMRLASAENGDTLISGRELATSPFLVHSMMSNIAFEQATIYTADARVRLMTELQNVNDYSDSLDSMGAESQNLYGFETRRTLSYITRQLHNVSQMINTGLGSSSSAVKLSAKLLQVHEEFCRRTGRGSPGIAVSRTHTAIQYVHDAYLYQQSWLEQYKTRKETAMNLVFNMVTQGDSSITLNTSQQMSQDSASIHALTVLAMIFLPDIILLRCISC